MKLLLSSILLIIIFNTQVVGQLKKAMTFNLRYDAKNDNENNWHQRKIKLAELVRFYEPDVLGTQEGLVHQLNYMDSCLSDYSFIGVGRDDGKRGGEFSAIFYNNKKLKVLKSNTFWLSETPEKVSIGWDASMERICTYGLFENLLNKRTCWVFNAHFDHIGKKAQIASMYLIADKIKEITNEDGLPIVLMGDFNISSDNKAFEALQNLLTDAITNSDIKHYGPIGTFNGFKSNEETNNRIDYIFTRGFNVLRHAHIDDRRNNNLCVSDHYPVLVEFDDKSEN